MITVDGWIEVILYMLERVDRQCGWASRPVFGVTRELIH